MIVPTVNNLPRAAEPEASRHTILKVSSLGLKFGKKPVLNGISFDVREDDLLCVLGPSGTGKTTLLNAIAGFLTPSSGSITLNGRNITYLAPEDRNIAYVRQSGEGLFEHLTVAQNITFPLRLKRRRAEYTTAKTEAQLAKMVQLVGLEGKNDRQVATLSGGERQRVALARALSYQPDLLLLDEPLSSLDEPQKRLLIDVIDQAREKQHVAVIMVTHNQAEARALAKNILTISDGRALMHGTLQEIQRRPLDSTSAELISGWIVLSHVPTFAEDTIELKGPTGRITSTVEVVTRNLGLANRKAFVGLQRDLTSVIELNDQVPQSCQPLCAVTIRRVSSLGRAWEICSSDSLGNLIVTISHEQFNPGTECLLCYSGRPLLWMESR